ncbi:MAG: hypothetical protein JW822_05285 [Spirochaetales bacterium]|nr:hypothetical protein [Spirochaetales bacterium]
MECYGKPIRVVFIKIDFITVPDYGIVYFISTLPANVSCGLWSSVKGVSEKVYGVIISKELSCFILR